MAFDARTRAFQAVTTAHVAAYRFTGGRVGGRMAGLPVLLLTTTGRRSGRRRTMPLLYLEDGGRLVLVASYGGAPRHPAWYLNLKAHPEVAVTRGRRTQTMTARPASVEERERLWPQVVASCRGYASYQEKTSRQIPLVLLTASPPG